MMGMISCLSKIASAGVYAFAPNATIFYLGMVLLKSSIFDDFFLKMIIASCCGSYVELSKNINKTQLSPFNYWGVYDICSFKHLHKRQPISRDNLIKNSNINCNICYTDFLVHLALLLDTLTIWLHIRNTWNNWITKLWYIIFQLTVAKYHVFLWYCAWQIKMIEVLRPQFGTVA